MKLWVRVMLLACGLFLISVGLTYLHTGKFAYLNSKGQLMFAPGAIATGALIICLAFLPPGDWVYRHISTKRDKVRFHHQTKRRKASER